MKVSTEYQKTASGLIKASIRIIDQGDYETCNIFSGEWDHLTNESELGEKETREINAFHEDAEQAITWVSEQLETLEGLIVAWRNIKVPDNLLVEF